MYQTSEQFNSAILGDYRKFQSKLRIGTSEITEGFRSIKQTIKSTNGDNISVGGAISSYIEVEMWYPQLLLGNAEIEWILSLETPSGGIEEMPMGLFTVQDPKEDDGVVRFTAYDRIYSKMGMPYFSKLNYPADGKDILREISSQTGVPIDVSTLPDGVLVDRIKISSGQSLDENGNAVTNETFSNPFDGYIHREALGNIAMLYGRIAVMDRAGNVVFKWYSNTDYSVGIDRHYGDLVLNESVFSVGTISCQTGSSVLTSGSGTENVYLENNIMTQSKLDAIYQQFQALEYIPATFSFLGDSRLDICDIITVHDVKGNLIKVPLMEIVQEYDGGLLTRVKSFGGVNQESSAVKGPTVQKMDRMYTELFLAKELIGNKASFEDLRSVNAEFQVVKANMITVDNLEANVIKAGFITAESIETQYAKIDLANIKAGSITTAMLGTAVVGTTQIADGSITDAKIVDLTANKINAGTLSVERLEIRGSNKSIVYALNNITGALQAQNVDTLNGEILTQRSIAADKIVANSITGNEIAAKTINANNINVTDLFAQDITATGTIRGVNLVGVTGDFTGRISANSGNFGSLYISPSGAIVGTSTNSYYPNAEIQLSPWLVHLIYENNKLELGSEHLSFLNLNPIENNTVIDFRLNADDSIYVGVYNGSTGYNHLFSVEKKRGIVLSCDDGTDNLGVVVQNSLRYGRLTVSKTGRLGIYDATNSKWLIYSDTDGAACIGDDLSVSGSITSSQYLYMGPANGGYERSIRFQTTTGTYQHYASMYGGNPGSKNAIGVWDNKNSRGVWAYDDVDNIMYVTPSFRCGSTIVSSSQNSFRSVGPKYGVVLHNNSSGFFILLTNEDDQYGSYNSLRPVEISLSTGDVYLTGRCVAPASGTTAIRPKADGSHDNGGASYRWGTVYSINGVKTTSDEREKDILNFNMSELSDCFMSLEPIAFRWAYGNDRKIHLGVGAQTTERKMIEAGYDPSQFDMIQHDELEERSVSGLMERYGINYQDLNMLTMMQTQKTTRELWKLQEWALSTDIELAVINQKQETQEARIRDLELQLADALFEIEQLKARIA